MEHLVASVSRNASPVTARARMELSHQQQQQLQQAQQLLEQAQQPPQQPQHQD